MNNLKSYPDYKESVVSWLGEVPERWEIKSLGSLTRPLNQRGSPDLPLLSVVREKGVILRSSMNDEENRNYVPDDLSNYKVVRKGNLVINKMKAWQGSMGIASQDGIVSPAYFVYDFNIADLNFGHALLRSKPYVALFGRASDGVRVGQWDLSPARMKRILVVIPPLLEQTAIVRYLDYMDRRIRRYINAKKKLITLLNEQKQAIIHQAVTRGLNPNVRLKPSGVEWLGDVPEHWKLQRAKWLFRKIDRPCKDTDEVVTCFRDGEVTLRKNRRVQGFTEALKETGYQGIHCGDLVIHTMDAFAGAVGVSDSNGKATPVYAVLTPKGGKNPHYYAYLIREMARSKWILALAKGIRERSTDFRYDDFASQIIPLPPSSEQIAIAQFLNSKIRNIRETIDRTNREIDLLVEYKSRLITDVVTGKLNVIEAAEDLPEEAEQPEDIEELTDSEGVPEEVALEPAIAEATDED